MTDFTSHSPKAGCAVITFPEQALGGEQGVALTSIVSQTLQDGMSTIVLDLSAVQVMNSSGLGMLVSTLASTGRAKASLVIAAVPDRVQSLLEMTHLVKVFTIVGSVHEAIAP